MKYRRTYYKKRYLGPSTKIMIIAGEVSGDMHGAHLAKELKKQMPNIELFGIGGPKMRDMGVELLYHISEMAFMGFVEVIKHLPFIWKVRKTLTKELKERKPELVIMIDYPGFNLNFASIVKKHNIPILYYISPQIWAWNKGRIKKIKKLVDKMIVVFPFELEIYRKANIDVSFVGHPLLEVLETNMSSDDFNDYYDIDNKKPLLGLLPGSRKQEIDRHLPILLDTIQKIHQENPKVQFVLGVTTTTNLGDIYKLIEKRDINIKIVRGRSYELMKYATLMIITSGTATLEAACLGVPMLIVYKVSFWTWLFARLLIRIKNIGLVNVITGKRVAPEYIQWDMTSEKLAPAALELINDTQKRDAMKEELKQTRYLLGKKGASRRTAEIAITIIKNQRLKVKSLKSEVEKSEAKSIEIVK